MRKDFFFGLVSVYDWEYLWGRTAAQIELRTIDQPIFVTKRDDSQKPKPGQKGYTKTADEAARDYERWKARQEAEKQKGIKIDLKSFIKSGKEVKVKK